MSATQYRAFIEGVTQAAEDVMREEFLAQVNGVLEPVLHAGDVAKFLFFVITSAKGLEPHYPQTTKPALGILPEG